MGGGENQDFPWVFCYLDGPKTSQGNLCCASETFGSQKIYGREGGEHQDFPSFFLYHSAENFPRGKLLVFHSFAISKKFG